MIEVGVTVAIMLALMVLRVPVFLAIGGAAGAFALLWAPILRGDVLAQSFLRGLDNQAFAAIPYFFAAGAIMNAGGMSARLLRLARALVAHVRGGLAHANVTASVVFAGISGSAVADAAAVGSVMIPAMERDGYPPAYAAAVTAASATIGLMIPPSIPMVIFALFTPADVTDLFVAGIVPGLMMGAVLLAASVVLARRRGYASHPWLGWGRVWGALKGSILALLMPVFVVAGLVGGVATVNEIGALAAIYAAVVTLGVYRDVTARQLLVALADAAADSAKILIVIAASGAFVWIAARVGLAREMAAVVSEAQLSPVVLLTIIAVTLLVLGTVLEPVTLLIVVAPVIAPVAVLAGIDVVQLGAVFVLASAIGLVTPPVGILLFMTAAQAGVPLLAVVREVAVFLAALVLLLAVVVAWPGATLGLGRLLGL
ncbi:tripartite ATP-independent transporter DctM subunit [Hasllibacter halocynthiae]|uniref:TRAP transporter large permease protein n=1 Tax=Hasllibacter halocynthiae TaxID=595589 RepID=A0A2T0X9U8_9RHOB|nr:TRAP transporter large permease [Hasllibacter halocynthiae]PRY95722.1 tripartite ATP-independent transporter DctM subunit [Hasllibacter halocynthiae]